MSALAIRSVIINDFHRELPKHGYTVSEIHAEPTPFNHQLWYLCAKTEHGFVLTYRSIWDGDQWEQWIELPRDQAPLRSLANNYQLPNKMNVVLEDWYTCLTTDDGALNVIDLRLGKRYGWEDEHAPFVFIYNLWHTDDHALGWSMNKPEGRYDFGRLKTLFARITGRISENRLQHAVSIETEVHD